MERKFTNIKERIIYLIEYKREKKETFFSEVGTTSANFRGKNINSSLNSDVIERILTKYDDISADWLLTGRGEMLKIKEYNSEVGTNEIPVAEPSTFYGQKPCELCKEKDKRIEELKDQIKTLKDQLIILQSLIKGIK